MSTFRGNLAVPTLTGFGLEFNYSALCGSAGFITYLSIMNTSTMMKSFSINRK